MTEEGKPAVEDHGEVVEKKGARLSLVWIFPILAIAAAAWLFWSDWKSQGPEIEIEFSAANGLEAGKTLLYYRGVSAGKVTMVQLDSSLTKALVKVRLNAFAADLAQANTVFWIDQPQISLEQISGLQSIVQGNSIQAQRGEAGPEKTYFVGLEKPPLTSLKDTALVVELHARSIPFVTRGAPVYYRGVNVGIIEEKTIDDHGRAALRLVIKTEYAAYVRQNARFWQVAATALKIGPGQLKLEMAGLAGMLKGGIAFDVFDAPGARVANGTEFTLYPNEREARSDGEPFQISFDNGQGLLAGETQVRYLGVPVGMVDAVKPDPATGRVNVTVSLEPGYDVLRRSDSVFSLIHPRISLEGVTGLETLISGVYIECQPGQAAEQSRSFIGRTQTVEEWNRAEAEKSGIEFQLRADDLPNLGKDAPVYFHGIAVGRIKDKAFDAQNHPYLAAVIRQEYAATLQSNARFWRMPATSIKAGPGVLKVDVAGLEGLLQGGVEFDNFGPGGDKPQNGAQFPLFAEEREAKAQSPPVRIAFQNGQGLLAGQTQLRYLGVPVGVVEAVEPVKGCIEAVARFEPGFDMLRRQGSMFTLVQAKISLEGVTGLESLVSGVYIECVPAPNGPLADHFEGRSNPATPWRDSAEGLEVVVTTDSTALVENCPVYYRNVEVGKVKRKMLSTDGRGVDLVVAIDAAHAPLVRANTKFWESSGIKANLWFISLRIKLESPQTITRGALMFATPNNDQMGSRAHNGQRFELNKDMKKEWERWSPSIPIKDN